MDLSIYTGKSIHPSFTVIWNLRIYLLDDDFNTKLSDFGLAKLGPIGDKSHVSTWVMGTLGYCSPDYAMNGKLTLKSDIYSFGVVLLELITGRRAIDCRKKPAEQNLVNWVSYLWKNYVLVVRSPSEDGLERVLAFAEYIRMPWWFKLKFKFILWGACFKSFDDPHPTSWSSSCMWVRWT